MVKELGDSRRLSRTLQIILRVSPSPRALCCARLLMRSAVVSLPLPLIEVAYLLWQSHLPQQATDKRLLLMPCTAVSPRDSICLRPERSEAGNK